ncbi:MAG: response regulator transcription factor [Spirochaetales bacterium]|nr:response regulator transcription factor [Spirochaetales bacterium]
MVHDEHDGIVSLVLAASGMPDGQIHGVLRKTAARYGWTLDIGDEEALLERSDLIVATSISIPLLAAPGDVLFPPLIVVVDDLSIVQNDAWSAPPVAALLDRRDIERRLPAALHAILAGLTVTAPLPVRAEPPPGLSGAEEGRPTGELSRAENAVYETLRRGLSNREIAEELDISVNTVKFHLSSIFAKLGVHNRTQAVAAAAHSGEEGMHTGVDLRTKFV